MVLILLNFYYSPGWGQTYNTLIADHDYHEFISKVILRDNVKSKHYVLKSQYPLKAGEFFYSDSSDFEIKNNYQNQNFIFKKLKYGSKILSHSLDTIFARKDIDFFGSQLQSMLPETKWKSSFKNAVLVDSAEHIAHRRVKHIVYRYSLPLFSHDRKYAIVIKTFYCGMLCGGGGYYIYRKTNDNNWSLVKTINEWGE